MAKRSDRSDLLALLDLVEDYLRDGFRRGGGGPAAPAPNGTAPAPEPPPAASLAAECVPPAPPPGASPPVALLTLADVAREVAACRRCGLHAGRRNAVPGEGAENPLVLVVGEGPGADEDRSGRPFVGAAGRYLDKWLAAVELSREANCFIANVVKCRPPGNRDPQPEEAAACRPFLERQIELLRPRAILTVGRIAGRLLLGREEPIGALRGRAYEYRGVPLVPTFHPSAVLRDASLRRAVWEDLKRLKAILDTHG